jgi:hypothetical protein
MEITATINNGTTTLELSHTATTAKMNWHAVRAAHELWDRGFGDHGTAENPIVWGDLTDQDKLDLLGNHALKVWRDLAVHYHIQNSMDDARETAEGEAETNEW